MRNEFDRLEQLFPCWAELTADQQNQLRRHTESRRFRKGDRPHQGSDDCAGLFLVKSGQLRAYILSESGKEITLYRLFARGICLFSASCIMKNINFDIHLEAEKDSEVFVVPSDLYEQLAKASLPVAEYTNQLMSKRFSDVMWIMEQVLFTSFDSRLATFLLNQSAIDRSDELKITHEEIARHLGSAREVVTRMLNYFVDEGAVRLSRGRVALTDKQKLNGLIQ